MKFRNFDRFGAFKYIKFVQTFFNTLFYVKQSIIRFDNTGCNLNERILAEERIGDCLPYICRFCFCKIIICFKNFIGLLGNTVAGTFVRTREISADIIKKVGYTTKIDRGTHAYRNDACVLYICCKCCGNFCYGELISFEVTIHKFFAGLCYRFHKDIMVFLQIFIQVFRNITWFLARFVNIFTTCLFDNVYVTDKFAVFTDREMKRCDFFAIKFGQFFYYFSIADVIHIHVCYEEHTRKFIFFTEVPCLLSTYLYTGFTGNNDDCCICCADSLFYFTHKIKISRCVKYIDFYFIPWYRNQSSRNRKMSFDLFFIKITNGISILYSAKAVSHSCQISHCLC